MAISIDKKPDGADEVKGAQIAARLRRECRRLRAHSDKLIQLYKERIQRGDP